MSNIYYDKKYKFFLKVSGGSSGAISVRDLMNCLWEDSGSNYTPLNLQKDTDLAKKCPCIIVIDRTLWASIIKKIKERLKTFEGRMDILKKIEDRHGETIVTKTYKESYEAEINRLKKVLNETSNVLKKFDQNIKIRYSFFNNSSIWTRVVIKDGEKDDEKIDKAQKEFKYFKNIGLYDYDSAKENLEYNIRVQAHNYLESTEAGHDIYVTPTLYGNEEAALEVLQHNKENLEDSNEGEFENNKNQESPKTFWGRIEAWIKKIFNVKYNKR